MLTGFLPIDKYLCLLIYSFKMKSNYFCIWRFKCLSIFAIATRIPTATFLGSTRRRVGSLVDIPVVG